MQLSIDFEGGLTRQFPDWMDVVRASVYDCGRPFKAVAADLDYAVSDLSRRLAPDAERPFPAYKIPELLTATGDLRPIYWLAERYGTDDHTRQKQAVETLEKLMPQLNEALSALNKGGR